MAPPLQLSHKQAGFLFRESTSCSLQCYHVGCLFFLLAHDAITVTQDVDVEAINKTIIKAILSFHVLTMLVIYHSQ